MTNPQLGYRRWQRFGRDLVLSFLIFMLAVLLGGTVALLARPAPSPTPRETPWSWTDPDRPIVCYFIGSVPIPPCYLRPVEEEAP